MNEKLIELVNTSLMALQEAVKTAQTELPMLAKEIVKFSILENVITFTMKVFVVIMSMLAFKFLRKKHKSGNFSMYDSEEGYYFGYAVICVVVFLCFLADGKDLIDITKVYFAPRLFLLEAIQKIITVK